MVCFYYYFIAIGKFPCISTSVNGCPMGSYSQSIAMCITVTFGFFVCHLPRASLRVYLPVMLHFCCGIHCRALSHLPIAVDAGLLDYKVFVVCVLLFSRPNTTIWLSVEHLSLECIWDTLYIFDGDSVSSPLLASLRYYRLSVSDHSDHYLTVLWL